MSSSRRIKSKINRRRARSFQALAAKARMLSQADAASAESPMLTKLLLAYGAQSQEANEILADQVAEQLQQSLSDILDEMDGISEEVKKVSGKVHRNNKVVNSSQQEKTGSTYTDRSNQKRLTGPRTGRNKGPGTNLFTKIGRGLTGAAEKVAGGIDDDVDYAIKSDPILLALHSIGKASRKIGVFMSGKKKGFQPERDRREDAREKLRQVESSREQRKTKSDCPSYEEVKQAMRESLGEYFAQNPIAKQQDNSSIIGDLIGGKVAATILKALAAAGIGLGSLIGKGIEKAKGGLGGPAKAPGGKPGKVPGKLGGVLGTIGKYVGAAASTAGKIGMRVLPLAGAAYGAGSAVVRGMEGDSVGAAIDGAAGVASMVPGVGTVIAAGLVGTNMVRDHFREKSDEMINSSVDQRTSVGKIYESEAGKPTLDSVRSSLDTVSKEFGLDRTELYAVARQESSFNPNANQGNDKDAKGLFQFVKSTWNGLIKKFPELQEKYGIRSVSGGIDDRYDPMKSSIMYAYLRKDDVKSIGNLTTGNSATDAYLAHFLGGPAAKKVLAALKESPNTSIKAYVSDNAFSNNQASFTVNGRPRTVKEFVEYVDSLMKNRMKKEEKEVAKFAPQITSLVKEAESSPAPTAMKSSSDALTLGPNANIDGLDENFKEALSGAAAEFKEATGKNVTVNSGHRSIEEQKKLYENLGPSKAAKPGSSLHNYGLAVDIQPADANKMDSMDLLEKYGLERPLLHGRGRIKPEPWHLQPVGAKKPTSPDSPSSPNVASAGTIKDVSSRISDVETSSSAPQIVMMPSPTAPQSSGQQSPPDSRVPPSRSTPSSIQIAQAAENRRVL